MGEVEVETFPTLLIADVGGDVGDDVGDDIGEDAAGTINVRFFGPLAPHAGSFARLIESIDAPGGPVANVAPDVQALAERLSVWR